jgi:hypothetical protein
VRESSLSEWLVVKTIAAENVFRLCLGNLMTKKSFFAVLFPMPPTKLIPVFQIDAEQRKSLCNYENTFGKKSNQMDSYACYFPPDAKATASSRVRPCPALCAVSYASAPMFALIAAISRSRSACSMRGRGSPISLRFVFD